MPRTELVGKAPDTVFPYSPLFSDVLYWLILQGKHILLWGAGFAHKWSIYWVLSASGKNFRSATLVIQFCNLERLTPSPFFEQMVIEQILPARFCSRNKWGGTGEFPCWPTTIRDSGSPPTTSSKPRCRSPCFGMKCVGLRPGFITYHSLCTPVWLLNLSDFM